MGSTTMLAFLIVAHPSGGASYYSLAGEVMAIGSLPENDVVLQGPFVSRRHARVEARGAQRGIIDLQSTNGVSVRGVRVAPEVFVALAHGDRVELGGYALTYWEQSPLGRTQAVPGGALLIGEAIGSARTDGLAVDADAGVLRLDGRVLDVKLSPLEVRLIAHLYQNAGRVCSRDELGAAVWGTTEVDGRSMPRNDPDMLYARLYSLKSKLRRVGVDDAHIVSLPGLGYRLDPIVIPRPVDES